jgi:orotidine-5'-phosphate decarboxylase
MMKREDLIRNIRNKKSFLCVGLDTDITRIPKHLLETDDPVFEFNKAIIDATKEHCVAYKPNIAFYESQGIAGWTSLQKTIDYIPDDIFTIADAKRGDIGNTSVMYAKTFFETYNFDSVTVVPYMGKDSVIPFLGYDGKWVILLALTSNSGASDFQLLENKNGKQLFEEVLNKSSEWGTYENMMYVAGATRASMLEDIRKIIPNHFILVPGVGAQGGSLAEVCKYGLIDDVGLLINTSRSVIYASNGINFATEAGNAAKKMQLEMQSFL